MATVGSLRCLDAVYANANAGTGILSAWQTGPRFSIFAGEGYAGAADSNHYYSIQSFISFDPTNIPGDVDSTSLVFQRSLIYNAFTGPAAADAHAAVNIAPYDYGSTLTTADWLSAATLSSLTPIHTISYADIIAAAGDPIIIVNFDLFLSAGDNRFVIYTDKQAAQVAPAADNTKANSIFLNLGSLMSKRSYTDPGIGGTYESVILADSPTVYWRLDETSGTVAADDSGNSNVGTYTNSPTLNQTPLISTGHSVKFPKATNAYVVSTNTFNPAPDLSGGMTLECLLNVPDRDDFNAGAYGVPIGFEDHNEIDIEVYSSDNVTSSTYFFAWVWTLAGGGYQFTELPVLQFGTTYHLIAGHDGTSPFQYINGDAYFYTPVGQLSELTYPPPFLDNSTNHLYVGNDSFTDPVAGYVDEAAFYEASLSDTRARAHYKAFAFPGAGASLSGECTDAVGISGTLMAARPTGKLYTVTKPDYCKDPSYHPDGNTIIFAEKISSTYKISTIISGGSHTVLHTSTNPMSDPAYSPDGEFVLFAEQTLAPTGGHTYGNWAIKYIDPDGVVNTIVNTTNANMHPVWLTPTQIAFQRLRYGTDATFHIVIMDLAGHEISDLGAGEYPRLVNI